MDPLENYIAWLADAAAIIQQATGRDTLAEIAPANHHAALQIAAASAAASAAILSLAERLREVQLLEAVLAPATH